LERTNSKLRLNNTRLNFLVVSVMAVIYPVPS
jgi:hypothetical protein